MSDYYYEVQNISNVLMDLAEEMEFLALQEDTRIDIKRLKKTLKYYRKVLYSLLEKPPIELKFDNKENILSYAQVDAMFEGFLQEHDYFEDADNEEFITLIELNGYDFDKIKKSMSDLISEAKATYNYTEHLNTIQGN